MHRRAEESLHEVCALERACRCLQHGSEGGYAECMGDFRFLAFFGGRQRKWVLRNWLPNDGTLTISIDIMTSTGYNCPSLSLSIWSFQNNTGTLGDPRSMWCGPRRLNRMYPYGTISKE